MSTHNISIGLLKLKTRAQQLLRWSTVWPQ